MSFNDPNSGLNRGKIIRIDDLNPEVTAKLPSGSFPIQDADIANMSATKLLGGAANQFIRWVAGAAAWVTLLAADIIAILGFTPENVANKDVANGYAGLDAGGKLKASEAGNASGVATLDASSNLIGNIEGKAIDTATVPADGNVLTFNGASNKWKPLAAGGLPAGADGNVIQYVGAVGTAQDLKLATKSIDNTVVPSDKFILAYDAVSGKVKFVDPKTIYMSEPQFLQSMEALGSLINVHVVNAASANDAAYTPANGKTFYFWKCTTFNGNTLQARSNGTVLDEQTVPATGPIHDVLYGADGKSVVGNGVIKADVHATVAQTSSGTLKGWIQ